MNGVKLGLYVHACTAWDFLVIDETDMEFIACTCFQPTPEILAIQDRLAVELDLDRSIGDGA